jgi:hypothetical protein
LACSPDFERDGGLGPGGVEGVHLGGRDVADALVQAAWLDQSMYSPAASSSCDRVRQTRSAMSLVVKLSTKLSDSALS